MARTFQEWALTLTETEQTVSIQRNAVLLGCYYDGATAYLIGYSDVALPTKTRRITLRQTGSSFPANSTYLDFVVVSGNVWHVFVIR